jgi:hypothetical protein
MRPAAEEEFTIRHEAGRAIAARMFAFRKE